MTLAQVIAWVRDQVNNLIDRIRGVAQDVSSGLANLRDWARGELSNFLNNARSFASNLFDSLKSWASNLIDRVQNGLRDLVETVRSFALGLYNQAIGWINAQIAWVNRVISTAIDTVRGWAIDFVNGLIAAVREWAQAQLNRLLDWVKELWDYLPLLKSLTSLLTATVFARLADLLTRIYFLLYAFASNPLAFLYSMMRETFQQFLCFALAYGLGTVEATLPPWPQWGGGGEIFPPIEPPPPYIPSGLILPLGHTLRICGYSYGPAHHAVDLTIIGGEPVFAMHAGLITEAGWSNVGYGFDVVVSGNAWWSRYAHFSSVNVAVGQDVAAGAILGAADTTGNSTGNHLHLEIKRGGQWVDPVTVLPIGG